MYQLLQPVLPASYVMLLQPVLPASYVMLLQPVLPASYVMLLQPVLPASYVMLLQPVIKHCSPLPNVLVDTCHKQGEIFKDPIGLFSTTQTTMTNSWSCSSSSDKF